MIRRNALSTALSVLALRMLACGASAQAESLNALNRSPQDSVIQLRWLNRVAWGVSDSSQKELSQQGIVVWMERQLHPHPTSKIPIAAQIQIDAMRISKVSMPDLVRTLEAQRIAVDAISDEKEKNSARLIYQRDYQQIAREAQQRFLLRALYSPSQLQEQMTWFWLNHFNVDLRKGLYIFIANYDDEAIRPYALGRFRDLLGATAQHPAMLRYLDNDQNTAKSINENYAREIMELHTMGVDGGYSQFDVQELARIFSGMGMTLRSPDAPLPNMAPGMDRDYRRKGLMEFHPSRHDYGSKVFLGKPMTTSGFSEIEEALDRLASSPATARFISRKLAAYFVADKPPLAMVERMAKSFLASNGDIAVTLQAMFESSEFSRSLGTKFRDPMHYTISSIRLAYDDRVLQDVTPLISWLVRMGQPIYGRETPDGYPSDEASWTSAGQMNTRFEIARTIGTDGMARTKSDNMAPTESPSFPRLVDSLSVRTIVNGLSMETREALARAKSDQEWNTFLLASPELMRD